MKKQLFLALCLSSSLFAMSPDEALDKLMEGNTRYMNDTMKFSISNSQRRQELTSKQNPFACVLGCSDSRVSPEIIFDQGLGDVFTVRVAGNVLDEVGLDSIEYSATVLGSKVFVVLGHKNCGAVAAVLKGKTQDIEALATHIFPAVKHSKDLPGDPLVNAIKTNVDMVVQQLSDSMVLSKLLEKGKIKVVGAYYDIDTGKVEILD